jgi:hypothetical protein
MNWEAIAAIGQMLGSIAVFVSLWHLAAQIRESSKLTRYQIDLERYRAAFVPDRSETFDRVGALVRRVDGGTWPVVAALRARYGLTEEDAGWQARRDGHVWRVMETEFEVFGPSEALERSIALTLTHRPSVMTWEILRPGVTPEFRAFVESGRGAQEA